VHSKAPSPALEATGSYGVTADHGRIRDLVRENTAPRNRTAGEIAGYRDVLATIHANHPHIPFTASRLGSQRSSAAG
jgi:hypothetical protein